MSNSFDELVQNWPAADNRWAAASTLHHGMMQTILTEVDRLRKEVERLSKENVDLKNQLNQPQTRDSGPLWSNFFNSATTPNSKNDQGVLLIAQLNKENKEKCQIEKNAILSGFPKEGADNEAIALNDKDKVTKVLNALGTGAGIDDVKRISRISSASNQDLKLIKIEFKTTETKSLVCKSAHKLRSSQSFNNIYLNEDKTKAERMLDKKLRDERNTRNLGFTDLDENGRPCATHTNGRKFYWGVRSGVLDRVYTK